MTSKRRENKSLIELTDDEALLACVDEPGFATTKVYILAVINHIYEIVKMLSAFCSKIHRSLE